MNSAQELNISYNIKIYLWLWTLLPAMKLPLPVPRTENIRQATSTFSPPWSPRTLAKNMLITNNVSAYNVYITLHGYMYICLHQLSTLNLYSTYFIQKSQVLPQWKSKLLNCLTEERQCCRSQIVVWHTKIHYLH